MRVEYRPMARQEACLRAALLPGEAGHVAWREAVHGLRLDRLDGASQALLPLVYWNLSRTAAGVDGLDALRTWYLHTWRASHATYELILPLLRALDEAGVEPIVLKGLALTACIYRDPGLRPMGDVDVLVKPADTDRACAVATRLGWRPRFDVTAGFRRVKHAAPFDHPAGVACDLHWRVFEEAGAEAEDDEFREAAVPVVFRDARFRVFAPTDQLFHGCGHAGREPMPAIRWAADAALLVRERAIDWDRFVAHAARRRFVVRMRRMIGYLHRTLGLVPPAVEAGLARQPVSALEWLEYRVRSREHQLLGELPTYVFNCLRGERRPLLAFPGYLRDAWALDSMAAVPRHALTLAARRVLRAPAPEG